MAIVDAIIVVTSFDFDTSGYLRGAFCTFNGGPPDYIVASPTLLGWQQIMAQTKPWPPQPTLDDVKAQALVAIDARSATLTSQGFQDGAGNTFALDDATKARLAWLDQYSAALTWPLQFPTWTGTGYGPLVKIASADDLHKMCLAALGRGIDIELVGAGLKEQVAGAADAASVAAVKDGRV